MHNISSDSDSTIDGTIHQRTGVGPNAMVAGWQSMLSQLLSQLAPYLKSSHIITFKQLTNEEKQTYEKIVSVINVPESACGVYISPSARNQMMYTNRGQQVPQEAPASPDNGVLLFKHTDHSDTLVNVLLARPPFSAAVDVYHKGGLLAGYVYDGIDDCLASLEDVVKTYLGQC